jgi:phosphatidylethanolamine/phosphatidyl-N-methylethanolamine N-methyltransferase
MVSETDGRQGHSLYDWWSRHPQALDILYGVAFLGRERLFRQRALDTLAPAPNEYVLEVGCGRGNSFEPIREDVGSNGIVVGLDVSQGMTETSHDRIRNAGWRNVHAIHSDARHPPVADGVFDAAYAAMSLSAVPDPKRAVKAVKEALRPGGRFIVLDAQPFQEWPWRFANGLIVPVAIRATNWVPQVDLVAVLQHEFETVVVLTFNAGSIVVACARKRRDE